MSNDNPYASPMAQSSAPGVGVFGDDIPLNEMVPGTSGQRLANYVVDRIAAQVYMYGVAISLGMFIALIGKQEWLEVFELGFADLIFSYLIYVTYFILQEALFRRTLGKLFSRTIVVNDDGGRPSFGQILGRSFIRVIPFEPFSALSKLSPNPWHDRWTGTKVVQLPRGAKAT